ncbi:MAG: GNAT family N-acetyltransferase [Butyrivibrio sp.]|jgi:RimJ/RimL family protein N-acetyltransferase|nr:GNAT family N-acetyltransferase [Butyrivibrio sp.]
MLITTERLQIRSIEEIDWRAVQQIWIDQKNSKYAQYDNFKDTEDDAMKSRIKRWAGVTGTDHMFYVVCLKRDVIGFVNFNKKGDAHEISYGFLNEYQGHGYAREAVAALLDYQRRSGITKFSAGTALENKPSVSLLEAVGFRLTGTEKVSFYKDAEGKDIFFDGGIFEA